jgi:hypothetical protein
MMTALRTASPASHRVLLTLARQVRPLSFLMIVLVALGIVEEVIVPQPEDATTIRLAISAQIQTAARRTERSALTCALHQAEQP